MCVTIAFMATPLNSLIIFHSLRVAFPASHSYFIALYHVLIIPSSFMSAWEREYFSITQDVTSALRYGCSAVFVNSSVSGMPDFF